MGSSKMKRVGLYLNEDLIKRADVLVSELGYGSRNEFFRRAVEEYITNCILKEEEKPLSKKVAGAIKSYSKDTNRTIAQAMFRYAVQLEMLTYLVGKNSSLNEYELSRIRKQAIKNVKSTYEAVDFDCILYQSYFDK